MDSATWAAIAAWVGVLVSALFSIRSLRGAKESERHQAAAAMAQSQAAAAVQQVADLLTASQEKQQNAELVASVKAALQRHPNQKNVRRLTVYNDGPARAEILSVTLRGEEVDVLAGPLDRGTERAHMIALDLGMPAPPWWVRIEYRDGRPEVQEWKQPLSF